jgi:hypothetical protein
MLGWMNGRKRERVFESSKQTTSLKMEESRKGGNWKLKSIDLLRDGDGTRK